MVRTIIDRRRAIRPVEIRRADGGEHVVRCGHAPAPTRNAGPVVTSLTAFAAHQLSDAATWEHQALTRARVICAKSDLGERFDEIRHSVLAQAP